MSDQLIQRILGELESLVLIDPHTHINPHSAASTTLADIMGYHYYTELAHSAIRFSLGRFNSAAEIDTAIAEINRVAGELKEKKLTRRRVNAGGIE